MPSLCTTTNRVCNTADKAEAALIGMQDKSTFNDHKSNTKKTCIFHKTLELKELSCQLSDTAAELKSYCILMKDNDATEKSVHC